MKKYIYLLCIIWHLSICFALAQDVCEESDKWQNSFEYNHYEWLDKSTTEKPNFSENINYRYELQTSFSDGYTPLWLNANKHGLSSIESNNGYIRGSIERPLATDDSHRWGIGYGVDLAGAYNYTTKIIIQQAYVEGRWKHGVLTIGQKDYPMELKDNRLSSGSQALGINARSVPQIRLAVPRYWTIPGLRNWVHIKGHLSYGFTTDDSWQRSFTNQETKYAENTLYHSKAGYVKFGKEGKPLSVEVGLEMACLFGGTTYYIDATNTFGPHKSGTGIKDFWHALVPGGKDEADGEYSNIEGNHLGSWVMRVNYETDSWALGVYADHYFEDHSMMFMVDYNGWGEGENYNKASHFRFFMHKIKDGMLGADLKLKNNRWLNKIVVEYLYTKHQSGPINHDRTSHISDHYAGRDDYYNHNTYAGWQHWGQVMGNPLYRSPIYNTDGNILVENNRFAALHFGISGNPIDCLSYRVLASCQDGLGTYNDPYVTKRHNFSMMAEATYHFPHNWHMTAAYGMDRGEILGNNMGCQFTITKTGLLGKKKTITK